MAANGVENITGSVRQNCCCLGLMKGLTHQAQLVKTHGFQRPSRATHMFGVLGLDQDNRQLHGLVSGVPIESMGMTVGQFFGFCRAYGDDFDIKNDILPRQGVIGIDRCLELTEF